MREETSASAAAAAKMAVGERTERFFGAAKGVGFMLRFPPPFLIVVSQQKRKNATWPRLGLGRIYDSTESSKIVKDICTHAVNMTKANI